MRVLKEEPHPGTGSVRESTQSKLSSTLYLSRSENPGRSTPRERELIYVNVTRFGFAKAGQPGRPEGPLCLVFYLLLELDTP